MISGLLASSAFFFAYIVNEDYFKRLGKVDLISNTTIKNISSFNYF